MLAMPPPTAVPMRAGSCLFYHGHVFAALRKTPSTEAERLRNSWPLLLRMGFAPSTFFEEELQLLSNPPVIAQHYPIPLQRLVGYDVYGGSFGYWGDRQHPVEAFNLESVWWADDLAGADARSARALRKASARGEGHVQKRALQAVGIECWEMWTGKRWLRQHLAARRHRQSFDKTNEIGWNLKQLVAVVSVNLELICNAECGTVSRSGCALFYVRL